MQVERCQEIFNRIVAEGSSAIDGFIVDREMESLFLDFKRSSDNGNGKRLSNIDRKNLARAISGFGNSEGGVIVWGVDCSSDMDGADVAHTKVYVNHPKRFASLIQGAVSGSTIPPHSGVENHVIELDGNRGFVITLIPKSNSSPHQMLPDMRYLIRAGSDFVPTPHGVLAGMFGRRPQPHVFQRYILPDPEMEGNALKLTFGLSIYNDGPGIASDIFCTCLMHYLPSHKSQMSTETPDRFNWGGSVEFWRQTSLISSPSFRLPPGASAQPLIVHLSLVPPFTNILKISGSVGCGASRKYDFLIECDQNTMQQQYDKYVEKMRNNSFLKGEKKDIASTILRTVKA